MLAYFRVNSAKSLNKPDFFYLGDLFGSIVGLTSGYPEKKRRSGRESKPKIGEFSFRGILQSTTVSDFTSGAPTTASAPSTVPT